MPPVAHVAITPLSLAGGCTQCDMPGQHHTQAPHAGMCCCPLTPACTPHAEVLAAGAVAQVGEEVPLGKVMDEGSDWRGRREQVIALKDQIRRLKEEQVGVDSAESTAGAGRACRSKVAWRGPCDLKYRGASGLLGRCRSLRGAPADAVESCCARALEASAHAPAWKLLPARPRGVGPPSTLRLARAYGRVHGRAFGAQGQSNLTRHDARHRTTISRASKERGAEMVRLAAEAAAAREETEKMRSQWAGAVSRRKVLEEEVSCQITKCFGFFVSLHHTILRCVLIVTWTKTF